jgi:hypothetical protein
MITKASQVEWARIISKASRIEYRNPKFSPTIHQVKLVPLSKNPENNRDWENFDEILIKDAKSDLTVSIIVKDEEVLVSDNLIITIENPIELAFFAPFDLT